MAFIRTLQMTHFRCYEGARLDGLRPGVVVLSGPNGAGKTNVLEAVSLLSPGRGLRGARVSEMQCRDARQPWAVAAEAETPYGLVRMGTGLDTQSVAEKRIVRINGETVRAQTALAEYLACVWLTPQMDRLFLEGASARRKFLDRLIFAFDPGHAGRVTRYENAMSQRSKILRENERPDPVWLDGLEAQMAETGVAIAAARLDFMALLQQACDQAADDTLFPRAILSLRGTIEELLRQAPALEVEDIFRYQLRDSRSTDARTGGAATGPHKGDLFVVYAAKSMPADQCSTGEQKALLIGITLAHSRLMAAERGAPPILLLDEVAAHLDRGRRVTLYEILLGLGGQVWMTGTDAHLFDSLGVRAHYFHVEKSHLLRRDGAVAA
ncbi:MAG: DNA replication/repair protein RecF [Micavibrio aeruginosavorus]|uniref:DNA replication and repair protein RecF n=1 Tax=Micavibrio aeruginosavorus TaxID=349221 RepID=A0A7T5UIH3_9BACT|nr:MAG: DNA replication/repair protein RecF [Micavibrio aeruginosavorus]